jgi:hypothetical protein
VEEPPDSPSAPPEEPQPQTPAPKVYEGKPVPREPNGRVARTAPVPEGETIGTPEQITALTIRLAEINCQPMTPANKKLRKLVNMERTRLMRRRHRAYRDKLKLRLIKAQTAEKVARRSIDEAAAAVDGTAKIMGRCLERLGKVAVDELIPFLAEKLKSEDKKEAFQSSVLLCDLTKGMLELAKRGSEQKRKAEKVIASWPEEGAKS